MSKRFCGVMFITASIVALGQSPRAAQSASNAAKEGPWFATPLPPGLTDPTKPAVRYDDALPPVAAKFAHTPGRHDELLDGAVLKESVRKIIGFSLESYAAGDKIWGRRASTPAFQHTIDWTVAQFKAAGITDSRVEPFAITGAMWTPRSWRVQLVGDDSFGPGNADGHVGIGISASRRIGECHCAGHLCRTGDRS